jgi:hypothetical protein
MTTGENERLAVVENEVKHVKDGLAEVKETVKGFDGKLDGVLLYIKGEQAGKVERRRQADWRHWALSVAIPAVISILGFVAGKAM